MSSSNRGKASSRLDLPPSLAEAKNVHQGLVGELARAGLDDEWKEQQKTSSEKESKHGRQTRSRDVVSETARGRGKRAPQSAETKTTKETDCKRGGTFLRSNQKPGDGGRGFKAAIRPQQRHSSVGNAKPGNRDAASSQSKFTSLPLPDGFKQRTYTGSGYDAQTSPIDSLTIDGIIAETNRQRKRHGVGSLTRNELLNKSAQQKSEDMAKYGYFSHDSPSGAKAHDFVSSAGYEYLKIAENIIVSTNTDDKGAVISWIKSREHKENLLNPSFTEIGVGIAKGKYKERTCWMLTQHFGVPKSSIPAPKEELEHRLDKLALHMESMKREIDEKKKKRKELNPGSEEDNNLVEEVNNLVARFNEINKEQREISNRYNEQVREYNRRLKEL